MKQLLFSSFGWLSSLLILAGCADQPSGGSMLSPADIDAYIVRGGDGSICLQSDSDSRCFTLIPKGANTATAPIIHIYSGKIVYVFSHEEQPIVRVQRAMDTTALRAVLGDTHRVPEPTNGDPLDTNNVRDALGEAGAGETGAGETDDDLFSGNAGWLIKVSYPAGRKPPPGRLTLESSGLKIKINGKPISGADIEGFTRITGPEGAGIQFFYPNTSEKTSRLTIEVKGLVSEADTVTFQIGPPTENRSAYVPAE